MLRRTGVVTGVALAVLVTVGYYKAAIGFLPIDATAVAVAIVTVLCIARVMDRHLHVTAGAIRILALFGILLVPCALASFDGYSVSKMVRLFGVTFVAALAPTLLFRKPEHVAQFLHAVVAVGVVVALEALVSPPDADADRLSAFGSNNIALGRATALPAAWLILLALHRRIRLWLAAALLIPLLVSLVGSGSRGPLLAVGVALMATMAVARRSHQRRRVALVWTVVIAGSVYAFLAASGTATDRLTRLGEPGIRGAAYGDTLPVIIDHPLGVGWGDWGDEVPIFTGEEREYPHNLILEVFAEGGWLVGLAVVIALWVAFRRAWGMAVLGVEGQGVFALFVFALMNAMVSGDINDNRLLWVAVGLSFAFRQVITRHHAVTLNART